MFAKSELKRARNAIDAAQRALKRAPGNAGANDQDKVNFYSPSGQDYFGH